MRKFLAYFIPILITFAIGMLGSYIQGEALIEWYPTLIKSPLTPPSIVFPIAWSILYLLIAISVGTLLIKRDLSVLRLWLLQLLLNFLWSVCFFALRSPLSGLLVILTLDVTVFAYIIYAANRRPIAAWLFVPYMLWLIFATYLNGFIYINNHGAKNTGATAPASSEVAITIQKVTLGEQERYSALHFYPIDNSENNS